jgi:hypothetical protein
MTKKSKLDGAGEGKLLPTAKPARDPAPVTVITWEVKALNVPANSKLPETVRALI